MWRRAPRLRRSRWIQQPRAVKRVTARQNVTQRIRDSAYFQQSPVCSQSISVVQLPDSRAAECFAPSAFRSICGENKMSGTIKKSREGPEPMDGAPADPGRRDLLKSVVVGAALAAAPVSGFPQIL